MKKLHYRFIHTIVRMVCCGLLCCMTTNVYAAVFAGPYTEAGISSGDPDIDRWATNVVSYLPVGNVPLVGGNNNSANTLGASDAGRASLGDLGATEILQNDAPGAITVSFSGHIFNGPDWDFAVFENGLAFPAGEWVFAELAYVEVSTNGVDFARFPSVSLTVETDPESFNIPDFGSGPARDFTSIRPSNVYNLAGKNLTGVGTPFDLEDLVGHPNVINGDVMLDEIRFVRIVDVPGDGSFLDSLGNPIYDAWDTTSLDFKNGGFDLDAVGVNHHQVPEPSSLIICFIALTCFACKVRFTRRTC